ncbi:MAG: hypothetical protein JWM31_1436, partial [Solirubrobacterales bacterium]|nr:hypothetical protein [Solirubrobacterales bacterium]
EKLIRAATLMPALLRRCWDPAWRAARARRAVLPAVGSDPLLLAASWGVAAPPNTVAAATAVIATSGPGDGDVRPRAA